MIGLTYRSRLSDLVDRTIENGQAPAVTAEDVTVVGREIERWNGSVVVTIAG